MKKTLTFLSMLLLLTTSGCSQQTSLPPADSNVQNSLTSAEADNPDITPGEDIIITMAVHEKPNSALKAAIKAFNEEDNSYQVKVENYEQYFDKSYEIDGGKGIGGYIKADFELQMDVMQGGVVDIVPDSAFAYYGRFDILEQKGAFIDLNPFLEKDEEVNRTTMNAHILDISQKDGKLYSLPVVYVVDTMIGPEPYVGTKENWTVDEMIERWNQMPENAIFNKGAMPNKDYVFMNVLRSNLGRFVDYKNVCCYFDSTDFVKILEFCNSFPVPDGQKLEPPEDAVTFAMSMWFTTFLSFHECITGRDGTPWTLVGYPSEDGRGAFINTSGGRYGICYQSSPEVQEGAWQFLKTLTTEDFLRSDSEANNWAEFSGFPVNNAFYKNLEQEEIHKEPSPFDEEKIGNPTQEECDRLAAYIASIPYVNSSLDNELEDIIYDELQIMFEGRQSPQQTADAIQSRASIYVSEKAG